MRRRSLVPSWLLPALLCGVSIGAAVQLKLHFDEVLANAAAASPVIASTDADSVEIGPDTLGSAAADPDFSSFVVVDDAGASLDLALGGDGPGSAGIGGPGGGPGVDQAPSGPSVEIISGPNWPGDAPLLADPNVWVNPASSGRPWHDLGTVDGLLTFRGNPTRTFHGRGPVPTAPRIQWSYDIGCSISAVAGEAKQWCGTGWTGQPAVFQLPTTGAWTVAFGAYNRAVNFVDPDSGQETLPPYLTGDIIKGSVTVDPDGYPLLYTGSRDNQFHVVALDGPEPRAIWQLSSDVGGPTLWNNDWDGSALIIDDHLFVGGENGRFYIVRLNRGFDTSGQVRVAPELVFTTESWDSELLTAIGDQEVSVENSVAISGNTVFFANSGGLVQGWDITDLNDGGEPTRTFRFWTGDDTDATIVIDDDGMLYVGSQYQRLNGRSQEIGQIMKLDPSRPDDPLVWSRAARSDANSGIWATPAIHRDVVIVATDDGEVLALDRATGEDRWRLDLEGPLWSSPVVVDNTLIQADCAGALHAFALDGNTGHTRPVELWAIDLGGCLESTPAVWDGQIFVGSRAGKLFAIGD